MDYRKFTLYGHMGVGTRSYVISKVYYIIDLIYFKFIPSHSCPTKPIEQTQIPVERSQYPFPEQFPSPGHSWSVVVVEVVVVVVVTH